MGDTPSCHVCGSIMTREWELLPMYVVEFDFGL